MTHFKLFNAIAVSIIVCMLGKLNATDLPADFPVIHTQTIGDADTGLIFMNVSIDAEGVGYYIMAVNNDGEVIKYKKLENDYSYDFKMQPNGLLSYAQFISHHSYTGGGNVIHMIVDEDLNPVDSLQMKNGYVAEAHDFQILPNGHMLAFGYYLTQMDLSDVVKDGYPNAMVSGGIIQEFDQDKNVVWQWRSWDHYDYKTYPFGTRRVNRATVSKFHLNTIVVDYMDDNILLSSPSWSKKISRQTGDVMWVFGGSYNEFSFIGCDSTEGSNMATGHTFHRIDNGNFLVFDNGDRNKTRNTTIHEFSLDEDAKVATLIRTIEPDDFYSSWHRGSAQKLPNGNYFVGWGGALAGDTIPAATEYDTAGNKIFELRFENPSVESYRAVRHPFPVKEKFKAMTAEIIEGNTDTMLIIGSEEKSGILLKTSSFTGDGYNEVYASYYEYAPKYPEFPGRAPMVLAKRVVLDVYNISALSGDLIFNIDSFGIMNPDNFTIYHREFEGNGLFVPLATSYNSVKRELKATFNRPGEFIFTYPDLPHVLFPPKPVKNENNDLVMQNYPISIEWAPKGFFNSFNLQVSKSNIFDELLIDANGLKSTVYELDSLENNTTYYWRAQTVNDAGTSGWSDTGIFRTSPSMLTLKSPNGGEIWNRGLDHFIEWESNDTGKVILELFKDEILDQIIDTVTNNEALKWEIPSNLDSACNYAVVAKILHNQGVKDNSDSTFAINDTTCTKNAFPYIKVLSPNGDENLTVGESHTISWENQSVENIFLTLYSSDTLVYELSMQLMENSYDWTVPSDLDTKALYKIRVAGDMFDDYSNGSFTISDSVTSIFNHQINSYKVFPNPAVDYLKIETKILEKINIRLFDSFGRLILSDEFMTSIEININDLTEGLYLLVLENKLTGKLESYKILK